MVFVCSMGDIFHKDVELNWIYEVFLIMERCPQHTFMLLTKRPERMRQLVNRIVAGHDIEHRKHIWLGVTAENQQRANERIPILLKIKSAVRFVSVEPMIGPIDLDETCHDDTCWREGLDWVICGAETGPGKRNMEIEWARALRNKCFYAGVPFFFKKDSKGERIIGGNGLFDNKMWEQYPTIIS